MNKRKREEFKPRFNYITTTANRVGEADAWNPNSNINEYQIVLAVGATVQDIKPGDIIKFETTAFPASDVIKAQDADKQRDTLITEFEDRLNNLRNSKGKTTDKKLKEEELKLEFQEKVSKINETAKVYAIPVKVDDFGEEFIWMSDRAVNFLFDK